jgi:hypothetical protein
MGVDFEILNTMGRLTARPDPNVARKAGTASLLTATELSWLEQAMALLIRRTGELGAGQTVRALSMGDLPSL